MTHAGPPLNVPPPPPPFLELRTFYERTGCRLLAMVVWVVIVLLILAGVVAYGLSAVPGFAKSLERAENLVHWLLPLALLVGPMVMIAASGGLDLSVGSVAALAAMMIAMNLNKGGSIESACASAMLVALGVGLVNGMLVGLLRVHGALVTLGMMVLLRGAAYWLSDARTVVTNERAQLEVFESLSRSPASWAVMGGFVLICILLVQLTPLGHRPAPSRRESAGRRLLAVGLPYVLSSLAAGVVGMSYLGRLHAASPALGIGLEIHVILAVALGGVCLRGRFGTVIGGLAAAAALVLAQHIAMLSGVAEHAIRTSIGAGILISLLLSQGYYALVEVIFGGRRVPVATPDL